MILRAVVTSAAITALCSIAWAADTTEYKPGQTSAPAAGAPLKSKHHARPRAPYKDCCGEGYRMVYAESWYNNIKVAAPVRRSDHGDQVLLPGGPWVDCELSCEYTLRKQTLSFWQGLDPNENAPPGYGRPDSYIDAWGQRRGYLF
jgi:hypothetical protein